MGQLLNDFYRNNLHALKVKIFSKPLTDTDIQRIRQVHKLINNEVRLIQSSFRNSRPMFQIWNVNRNVNTNLRSLRCKVSLK